MKSRLIALCVAASLLAPSFVRAEDAKEKAEVKLKEHAIQDIKLKLPESWKSQAPENKLRLAQFVAPNVEGEKEETTLVVSSFAGGDTKANFPRWVGEFQGDAKAESKTGESALGPYEVTDLTGTHVGPSFRRRTTPLAEGRVVMFIVMPKEKPYYYLKLTGPSKSTIAAAKTLRAAIGADAAKEKAFESEKDK